MGGELTRKAVTDADGVQHGWGGHARVPKVINFETKFPFVYKCFKEGRDELKFYVKK